MKIPVVFLSLNPETPARDYWDMGMLEDVFSGKMWKPATSYEFEVVDDLEACEDGAVIVFPARAQTNYVKQLNTRLRRLKWVVIMLTGDEEASFPVNKLNHPNMRIWVMSPRPDVHNHSERHLGTGYPPQAREWLPKFKKQADERKLDYYFAGQVTHDRRREMAKAIADIVEFKEYNKLSGVFLPSAGFTQGEPPERYYELMASSKIAYAPSGPETPDSFRLFEALEAGCIPIADTRDPKGVFPDDYWQWFFDGQVPFPIVTDYATLQGKTTEARDNWKQLSNDIFSWWQSYKRDLCYKIMRDVHILAGFEGTYFPRENFEQSTTVIMPTSVIPSHPSTAILEETIEAVRAQLPEAEIIITFDGIREQQKDRTADYEEYIRQALWLCNNKWHNVLPVVYREHNHQARMLREVLSKVRTPYILYVEHDAPVVPDREIQWEALKKVMDSGEADVIRLHHEELVLPEHKHLMFGCCSEQLGEAWLHKTMQWSQRPHIARVSWYERIIDQFFHPESRTMIEDVLHGIVQNECQKHGINGWYNFRIWLYTPKTDKLGIKRSYHTDGRGADSKYEMDIIPVGDDNERRN